MFRLENMHGLRTASVADTLQMRKKERINDRKNPHTYGLNVKHCKSTKKRGAAELGPSKIIQKNSKRQQS